MGNQAAVATRSKGRRGYTLGEEIANSRTYSMEIGLSNTGIEDRPWFLDKAVQP
jgi:hypothetical protein